MNFELPCFSDASLEQSPENSDDEPEVDSTEELEGNDQNANHGWADAMANILKTSTQSKHFMLSKAKKDADVRIHEAKDDGVDIEAVGEAAVENNIENLDSSSKKKQKCDSSKLRSSRSKLLKVCIINTIWNTLHLF